LRVNESEIGKKSQKGFERRFYSQFIQRAFSFFYYITRSEFNMPHPVKVGKKERMSYSQIDEVLDIPNLIELQKQSYQWFLEKGLREVFNDISPIEDYTGNLILEFVDYSLDENPKYDVEDSKERDVTYAAPLKVKLD
jgi:DNA-directed RNA polymerase beta subunit